MMIRRATMAVVSGLLLLGTVACGQGAVPRQPLPFDHALHMEVELEGRPLRCVDCHAGAERAEHAGLPALRDCLRCHMRPQAGKDGEPSAHEQRVRELAAAGGPFRWTQVTRNPGHVYASHRAHVGVAKLSCEICHGDVTSWTAAPARPDGALLSMDRCLACHRERGASTQCGSCHR